MNSTKPQKVAIAALLMAGLAGACSDGGTDPDPIPNIAGNYTITESLQAATCSPNQLPATGGTVILEPFTQSYTVQIEQTGSVIHLFETGFADDPEIGTITADGKIALMIRFVFQEAPRGDRVFVDDLTLTRTLTLDEATGRITGTGSAVNVFHENVLTAPVYTTCSRQATITLTRI